MGYTGDVERWLKAVVETAQEAIFTSDVEGHVTSWNPAAQALYGYAAEEMVGRSAWLLMPEECHAEVLRMIAELRLGNAIPPFETVRLHKDGHRVRVSVAITPVRGADDEMVGLSVSAHAVGDERAVREALRRSEETLRVVIDSLPFLFTYVDASGRYCLNNRAYADWYGMDPAAMQGRPMSEVLPPGVWSHIEGFVQAALAGDRIDHETRIVLPDGTEQWIRSLYVPHRDVDGSVRGFVGVVQDVTDRKAFEVRLSEAKEASERQAAALAALDRRKDEFLISLSHELRAPLTPVAAALELLRQHEEQQGDTEALHLCHLIARQMRRLGGLVDDLLDAGRIAEGKLRLDTRLLDLRDVIRATVEAEQTDTVRLGHRAEIALPPDPVPVLADDHRLQQVFTNLLHNAAKYTPPGRRLGLRLHTEADTARVEVWDQGVGIEPELLPRIFDLFVQSDRKHLRSEGGLGVGLNLVRRLVELHGGEVGAHSDGLDAGSTFTVRLPLAEPAADVEAPHAEAQPTAPESLPQPVAHPQSQPRRVLIVEDDRDSGDMLGTLLSAWGHLAEVARTGAAALEAVESFGPDMVLLDLGLPDIDGIEVARRLRAAGATVRIVGLTGQSEPEQRRRAREAGIIDILVKPPRIERLKRVLASPPDGTDGASTGD